MKLENHIGYTFLTDEKMIFGIIQDSIPKPQGDHLKETLYYLSSYGNKNYYIAETVVDKLDMLKVRRDTIIDVRLQDSLMTIGTAKTFNWSVFDKVKDCKLTFLLPDNSIARIVFASRVIWFCLMSLDGGYFKWSFFYYDKTLRTVSQNWNEPEVQTNEEFIYKLLCFFYLSENEEVLLQPGQRHGTRKHGKIINSLPMPITIVNSKWNVTSIRTEGFPVSGHFRLQPIKTGHKMIFIEPYEKHGYIRHAKKQDEV